MTPPVSETAAWTEQDERDMKRNALATDLGYGDEFVYRLARAFLRLRADIEAEVARRAFYEASMGVANGKLYDAEDEIARLRAENERMVDAMHEANAKLYHEAESLRSALAAAQEAPSETDAAAKEQWRSNPPYPIWLVERTDNGYAEWLKSSIGLALVWTTEASEALWHETEDEAHAMIRSVRKSGHYMPTAHVTDHRFLARSELAAATRERETPR